MRGFRVVSVVVVVVSCGGGGRGGRGGGRLRVVEGAAVEITFVGSGRASL